MQYDPIKKVLGKTFGKTPKLRLFFFLLLELLLLRSWYVRRELKKWKKTAPITASVFDAGAGLGQYCWRLSKMGKELQIVGCDINIEQVEDCINFFKKIGLSDRVNFINQDITKISEKEHYNLILMIDVLEHIEDDKIVLRNMYQALRNGGTLIISTPSDLGGSDAHIHNEVATGFVDEHVRNGYNKQDIEQKLKDAGFNNLQTKYTYGFPGNISWILSMKIPIIILNISKLFFILLPFYYLITYPFALILNCFDINFTHKKGTGIFVIANK